MKKIISLLFIISFVLAASGQNVARIDTGTVNHAAYKILFPKEWHRKLILFAHGYEFMGSPSSINGEQFLGTAKIFLGKGFAVAASAYGYQGYALPRGVDDTEALRQYFLKKYQVETEGTDSSTGYSRYNINKEKPVKWQAFLYFGVDETRTRDTLRDRQVL